MSSMPASAASLACARVSATTKATGSPTKRTLSVASEWRTGIFIGEPSRVGTGAGACGPGDQRLERPVARCVQVGAGPYAQHARHRLRFLDVDALQHAVRH